MAPEALFDSLRHVASRPVGNQSKSLPVTRAKQAETVPFRMASTALEGYPDRKTASLEHAEEQGGRVFTSGNHPARATAYIVISVESVPSFLLTLLAYMQALLSTAPPHCLSFSPGLLVPKHPGLYGAFQFAPATALRPEHNPAVARVEWLPHETFLVLSSLDGAVARCFACVSSKGLLSTGAVCSIIALTHAAVLL